MWNFLSSNEITITVEYFPSILKIKADLESRQTVDSSEWIFCQKVFQNLCLKSRTLSVDLFAPRIFHQITKYVAWKPNPYSIATDTLPTACDHSNCYAFFPFCLMPYFLSKIRQVMASNLGVWGSGNYKRSKNVFR